jgi:hypothetical protein
MGFRGFFRRLFKGATPTVTAGGYADAATSGCKVNAGPAHSDGIEFGLKFPLPLLTPRRPGETFRFEAPEYPEEHATDTWPELRVPTLQAAVVVLGPAADVLRVDREPSKQRGYRECLTHAPRCAIGIIFGDITPLPPGGFSRRPAVPS